VRNNLGYPSCRMLRGRNMIFGFLLPVDTAFCDRRKQFVMRGE